MDNVANENAHMSFVKSIRINVPTQREMQQEDNCSIDDIDKLLSDLFDTEDE